MRPIYCQALVYADDILLIAESEHKLQQAVTEWTEILSNKGLIVNTNKSKIMQMAKTEDEIKPLSIVCNGSYLEQVQSYEYLGTIIHQNGKIMEEILYRDKKANGIYSQLSGLIFGKKEIKQETKLQIYNSIIEPTLLYGAES